jgi:hypothetical protein
MSTVFARRVVATPVRTAAQTWDAIAGLLAPDPGSTARQEIAKAAGVACASIASESIREAPIVVWGGGPRVRVYGLFDEDAITGEDANETALPQPPLQDDWKMSIPCAAEDVAWSNGKLASISDRISARAAGGRVPDDAAQDGATASATKVAAEINLDEFLKS